MGDCLRAGKPSHCEACQLGRLNLLPSASLCLQAAHGGRAAGGSG